MNDPVDANIVDPEPPVVNSNPPIVNSNPS